MNSENRNIAEANIAIHARCLWMAFCCLFATSVVLEIVQPSESLKTVAGEIMEISFFATNSTNLYEVQNDPMAEMCHITVFHYKNRMRRLHGWRHLAGKIPKRTWNTVHSGTTCMLSLVEFPRPPNPQGEQSPDLPDFYTFI